MKFQNMQFATTGCFIALRGTLLSISELRVDMNNRFNQIIYEYRFKKKKCAF